MPAGPPGIARLREQTQAMHCNTGTNVPMSLKFLGQRPVWLAGQRVKAFFRDREPAGMAAD
jgi:hypothetical protein